MASVRVRYDAPETMARFMDSDAFVRFVVGPVGSGKSSGCILEIIRRAREQAPGPDGKRRTRFAVIRNTYPELRDTTRNTFEQWVPGQLGKWNEQALTFEMEFGDVHCEVMFRALDSPRDIKKLLSLELTGAYINEAREVPKEIFDVLQTRVGRYPSRLQGGPTWFGIWADTNPWHAGHWADELFDSAPQGMECYWQPDGLSPEAENVENLPAGYYERLCAGKDSEWVDVYVRGKKARSDVGSIYGNLLDKLGERGGLAAFPHDTDGIFTAWDIGISDAAAIWFFRHNRMRGSVDFVDHYENSGFGLSHYFDEIDKRARECGYAYAKHFLPHDARARTFQTGTSVLEQCLSRWGANLTAITPSLSIADGISATRFMLEQDGLRIHPRCADGLKALRAYKRKWDDEKKVFSDAPVHDWASNSADAARYAAIITKMVEPLTRPAPVKPKTFARSATSFSLDELFEFDRQDRAQRR